MKRINTLYIILVMLLAVTSQTRADMFNLTGSGTGSAEINEALFYNSNSASTGTGYIQPFLRIQKNGIEQGYNTDYRASNIHDEQFPEMIDPWTQSLLLIDVPTVDIGGTLYREFLLDLHQNNSAEGRFISLDKLEIYQADSDNLTNYSTGWGTPIYEMGLDGTGASNWIILDSSLNSGSGSGDMFAYIPYELFDIGHDYVYLYSMFGVHNSANATFEEWAVRTAQAPPEIVTTPVPGAIILGLLGLGVAGIKLRKYA